MLWENPTHGILGGPRKPGKVSGLRHSNSRKAEKRIYRHLHCGASALPGEFGEKSDLTFYRVALTFPAVNPSTKMKLKNGTLN